MEDVTDGYTSAWSDSTNFSVIYGPDKIRFNPVDIFYTKEENTILHAVLCEADCYPTCIFRWTKAENGATLTNTAYLQLGNVTRAQNGTYRCTATRSGSVSASKDFVLNVAYAPKVSIRLMPSIGTLGRGLKILCEAYDGFPESYNYKGFVHTYNGQVIPIISPAIFGTPQNTSLNILYVRIQDMGTYSCSVNNGVSSSGTIDQTASVDISFEAQPEILLKDREYFGSISGTIKVLVPFYSFLDFQNITLIRSDGLEIMKSDKYNLVYVKTIVAASFYGAKVFLNGTVLHFTINGLTPEDFSSYVVVISNNVGYVSTDVVINQKRHPVPPQDFMVSMFPGVLLFSWTSSSNGGDEQSFLVQMSREGTNRWDNQTLVHEYDAGHMITAGRYIINVTEPTQGFYQCRIIAVNSLGHSEAVYLQTSIEIKWQKDNKSTEAGEFNRDLLIGTTLGSAVIGLVVCVIILAVKLHRLNLTGDSVSVKQ